ncbi:putative CBF Mak21 family [Trypanosoma vivax]|uniref:CCAAT-binding factor domain-containing protein n=1 Tax=Trypanosoma vivax (strain Y486) TaxID=1055687 RepID=G0UA96_TRYVY|nr:hypothetical protein TRVL_04427 [Trypanosoma vivax]KAH8617886.1 putative CBF Mak21 family [Trypanosoma vivax]CCC52728.1 conserved hypothetical protein [Trypanosoma vivax Y486]
MCDGVLDLSKRWFERPLPLRSCSLKEVANSVTTKEEMHALFQEAQGVLDDARLRGQGDRSRWYSSQFISRGTMADKIASAAVKLSDTDFMFFLEGFNLLFDTARSDAHHCEAALKALTAVWPKLMPRRPLKRFVSQFFATLPTDTNDRKCVLVYWYIEDYLKRTYAQFLSLAEAMLKDRLQKRREAWLETIGKLMCSIAEGRHVAMSLIVDKLGDPSTLVAHNAYHHLLGLLKESSIYQSTLFVEIEKVVFMKNCPVSTMKYAANVMNQFVFTKEERRLALRSVQTYLSLFRQLVTSGSVDLSVTTAILVGLRRAFPYAGTDIAPLEDHINALFVLANTGSFVQRVATLSLLQLVAQGKGVTDAFQSRWYRTLYKFLLISPKQISHSGQMAGFFTMLHKALRLDKNEERVAAFVHRLLQRALYFDESVICAILLLVGEVLQERPRLRALLLSPGPRSITVKEGERYDMRHREPQYAHATNESVFTLGLLARHSHPSVVKLAVMLLFNEEIVFDSHPLDELSLQNFLQMFVDARPQEKRGTADELGASGSGGKTGVSVFQRTVHKPNIPSASDPYFINTAAQHVDVSALFLHRYAVQRQRFFDGLSQVRSAWGNASGEEDVAMRISDIDSALFGPSGLLTGSNDQKKARRSKKKSKKECAQVEDAVEMDEVEGFVSVPSETVENNIVDGDESDDVLEWGSSDGATDGDLEEDEDANEGNYDGELALGGTGDVDVLGGEDLAELLEANRGEYSRKRKREREWLDRATA